MTFKNHKSGFIALVTTIILTLVILTLVIAVGFSSFFGRANILGSEVNERSTNLAEACVETAILKIFQDEDYGGRETIKVGSASCYICQTANVGSNIRVLVQASSSDAFTNLRVDIDPTNDTDPVDSWTEIASTTISGSTCI